MIILLQHQLVLAHISNVLSFREGTYLDSNLPGTGRFLPRATLCDCHVIFHVSCFSQARQHRIAELLPPGCSFCPACVGAGHPAGSHCPGPLCWPGREDSCYPADSNCPYVKIFAGPVFFLNKLKCDTDIFNIVFVGFLWANDLSGSRTTRLRRTLQSYVPKELRGEDKIRVTSLDGRKWRDLEDLHFDRVSICGIFLVK